MELSSLRVMMIMICFRVIDSYLALELPSHYMCHFDQPGGTVLKVTYSILVSWSCCWLTRTWIWLHHVCHLTAAVALDNRHHHHLHPRWSERCSSLSWFGCYMAKSISCALSSPPGCWYPKDQQDSCQSSLYNPAQVPICQIASFTSC